MTARHQVRIGVRRTERDLWSIESLPAPSVGELLLIARERKGVTLERAERDTKIRARHLAALENGDPTALPAPVYAKGFLRNYALYLGLDADEMLMRWRSEQDELRPTEKVAVTPPPQPITAPRRGLLFTPGLVVAAILSVVVVAFAGYVVLQLVRFAQNPEVTLDGPAVITLAPDAKVHELSGVTGPGIIVSVTGASDLLLTATADDEGRWSLTLPVAKGQNDFNVVARDQDTGRQTEPLPVIASVPVDGAPSPSPSIGPARSGAAGAGTVTRGSPSVVSTAVLAVNQPADRSVLQNGRLRILGASDAGEVVISFEPLGGGPERSADVPTPVTLPVEDGGFSGRLQLASGRWRVIIETVEPGGAVPASVSRVVRSRYAGLVVQVAIRDGQARVRATLDGEVQPTELLADGETRTWTATEEIVIRSGNRQATWVSRNGRQPVQMGKGATAETWVFAGDASPVRGS